MTKVPALHVAIYGDVDLNLIDGSSIWLASLVQALSMSRHVEVFVILKAREYRSEISGPLASLPGVTVIYPPDETDTLAIPAALNSIESLDEQEEFDAIILRGYLLCQLAAIRERLRGRLWCYLTDIPQKLQHLSGQEPANLKTVLESSSRFLCQTEDLRSFLECVVPAASRKSYLLPPMVPPDLFDASSMEGPKPPTLFYAGKFAPMWGFLEMVQQFSLLRRHFSDATFLVAGDKIHDPPEDPSFYHRVTAALETTEGLVWYGGVPRTQIPDILVSANFALSVRDNNMNDSLELSTKLLEYGAAGVPVVCNRTASHEALFGVDYPLFVDGFHDLHSRIEHAIADPAIWLSARETCRDVAQSFSFDQILTRLESQFRVPTTVSRARRSGGLRGQNILIAGHDLKFFDAIKDHLLFSGANIEVDHWAGHDSHDQAKSDTLLAWADIIICEWCLGNAVWYSRNKQAGQRLIVRLHRQEFETTYPSKIVSEQIDRFVFVSSEYRKFAIDEYGWPPERAVVIPNGVDDDLLDRDKLPGARFNLGLLGYLPRRKRLDHALDIVEGLRAWDDRFHLYAKGQFPPNVDWLWKRDAERSFFVSQFQRVAESPLLSTGVSFEQFSSDVPAWYRKIGFILSTSEAESFHVSAAEGMASRSVPVILPWTGSQDVYTPYWTRTGVNDAITYIRSVLANSAWLDEGEKARCFVKSKYSYAGVLSLWLSLLARH